jgi:hypothetical protein
VQWARNSYLDNSICLTHKAFYGELSQVRSLGRKDCEIGKINERRLVGKT